MNKRKIGNEGEEMAVEYLENEGYEIFERNFQKRSGEIDIIAFDKKQKEYVFVEVKKRATIDFGYPEEMVDEKKALKIEKTAEQWLQEKKIRKSEWRIDIIGIEGAEKKIRHIKNISIESDE